MYIAFLMWKKGTKHIALTALAWIIHRRPDLHAQRTRIHFIPHMRLY